MRSKIVTALLTVGMMVSIASAGVVSKGGIAKDSATGLMWQDEPYTDDEKEARDNGKNYGKTGNWEYANGYCTDLILGGYQGLEAPKCL